MPFESMCSRPRAMFRTLALTSLALGLQLGLGALTSAEAAQAVATKAKAAMQAVPIPLAALLPQPQAVTANTGQAAFLLNAQVPVLASVGLAGPARSLAQALGLRLKLASPGSIPAAAAARIRFEKDLSLGMVAGAYRLQIKADEILIHAAEPSGAFYATQTLMQLLPQEVKLTAASASFELAAADIIDAPRFEWRGIMLDVARHFHDVTRVKRVIDNMAFYKLNRLHLHLSDDQGWRLAIQAYPKLSTVGGRGDHSRPR